MIAAADAPTKDAVVRLHSLTGLRFVAAAMVFYHHASGKFGIEQNTWSVGAIGVSFFFVLSGFILVYVYHNRLEGWSDVRRFWFTRFARIWPLHVVCLAIAVAVMPSWTVSNDATQWPKFAAHLFLLQSWIPQTDWVLTFNAVSWSISTEAFFYFVFPLIWLGDRRRLMLRIAAASAVALLAIAGLNYLSSAQILPAVDYFRIGHVNPLVRLPEFCIGMLVGNGLVAAGARNQPPTNRINLPSTALQLVTVAALVLAFWFFNTQQINARVAQASWGSEFLGSWLRVAWPAPLFATVIFAFARRGGLPAWLLEKRLLIYLGEISYSQYLIHFLVIRSVDRAALSYGQLSGWTAALCCLAISLGLSMLLYELIETPCKKQLLKWFDRSKPVTSNEPVPKSNPATRTLIFGVVLTALPILLLITNAKQIKSNEDVLGVIAASRPELRNINFGSQIRLLGCQVDRNNRGGLKLQFAWAKRTPMKRDRKIRIYDSVGNTIGRGKNRTKLFQHAEIGEAFVDRIELGWAQLAQADQVVVLFRVKGLRRLPVERGPRTDDQRELVLLDRSAIGKLLGE